MIQAEPWNPDTLLKQIAHKGKHDFEGPIRAVRNFSALLADELQHTPDSQEYLSFIQIAGERLNQMVSRLAFLIRLEELRQEPSDISLKDLFSQYEGVTCDDGVVRADSPLMKILVQELMENAQRYGALPVRIHQSGSTNLTFEDEGPGLDPEECAAALQPFRRLVSATHSIGAGLGLPIAAHCMDLMGGTLAIGTESSGCGLQVHLSFAN